MSDVRQISSEEFILSMVKHNAWNHLKKFIEMKTHKDGDVPEFAEFWKSEFFDLETRDEIEHFMKSFPRFWVEDEDLFEMADE